MASTSYTSPLSLGACVGATCSAPLLSQAAIPTSQESVCLVRLNRAVCGKNNCNPRPQKPVSRYREWQMELLERFAAGDLEAFETLFRTHQKEAYAWVIRIVRDHGIAEDLTVETFWRIYQSRSRFDPAGNFRAWCRRIATNAALDHLRHARRETELPNDLPGADTGDPVARRETRERIKQSFFQLPAKYRVVATLALIEEEPYNEIAEALGISVALVKVRLFRAVRMLRKKLNSLAAEAVAK
jgi:RNA polymerase sigma factor (sigma-70 family)